MKIFVLIVSDRTHRGERGHQTGPKLCSYLKDKKNEVYYDVVPDEIESIKQKIFHQISINDIELVLTSGGTGFSKRDITPEATKQIIEREAPGIAEYIRMENFKNSKNSYLSRGVSGIYKETIIINLPGSPDGALQSFKIIEDIIPHAVETLRGRISDCKNI